MALLKNVWVNPSEIAAVEAQFSLPGANRLHTKLVLKSGAEIFVEGAFEDVLKSLGLENSE